MQSQLSGNITASGETPFRYWVFDNWYAPLAADRMADALNHHWQVHYSNDLESGKRTSRDFDTMLPELRTAFIKLRHPDTVQEFAVLTGIPSLMDDPVAHGAGLHLSTDRSYLQTHVDYEIHPTLPGKERRLNLILFMHNRWEQEWGGQLLLSDSSGEPVVAIAPIPGRLVAFECGVSSYHGVRVVGAHQQAIRLSCAVYYLADARPTATRARALFLPNRNHGGVPNEVAARATPCSPALPVSHPRGQPLPR